MPTSNTGQRQSNSGGGFPAKTDITGQDGTKIDLGGMALQYGPKDSTLSGEVRGKLEAQENKRLNAKIEYAITLDADGNQVGEERRGGKGSVRPHVAQDGYITHNHPRPGRETGMLGGTFSHGDIEHICKHGERTMRASAAEGTYSISKAPNFNARGMLQWHKQAYAESRRTYAEESKRLQRAFDRGEMTFEQATAANKVAMNQHLVRMHNALAANAERFGYTYTLEGR